MVEVIVVVVGVVVVVVAFVVSLSLSLPYLARSRPDPGSRPGSAMPGQASRPDPVGQEETLMLSETWLDPGLIQASRPDPGGAEKPMLSQTWLDPA